MKKILFVWDENHYPQGAFEWMRELHKQEPLFIKGVCFAAPGNKTASREPERFMDQCHNCSISSIVVEKSNAEWQKNFWEQESRYADLLVFSPEQLYAGTAYRQSNRFQQQLLRWANCPVLAVPENTGVPEHLLAAYDGSPQSMHALKQCCLLFPQYRELPVRIAYVKEEDSDHIPQLQLLTEYAQTHFADVKILKLRWDSDKHFSTWVECFRNPLLITGAFGRSALSTSFKESFVTKIITDHVAPIFIAH